MSHTRYYVKLEYHYAPFDGLFISSRIQANGGGGGGGARA